MRHPSTILLVTALLGPVASAQTTAVPRLRLGNPTASPTEQFSEVTGLAELAPGRLLVGDARERRLVVLDLATGSAQAISRIGAGPREFRSVSENFLPRPGGGAWVVDFAQRRLLPVNPDGSLADAITMPMSSMLLRASDAAGRVYGDVMIFSPERQLSDTVQIVRWDPATTRVDTLQRVHIGRAGMVVQPGGTFRVFRATTTWTVLPAGAWIGLEADGYVLTEWQHGRMTRTTRLPRDRVAMTSADQAAWRAQQAQTRPMVMGQPGGRSSGDRPEMQYQFPEHYPAFDADAPLRRDSDGRLWIERLLGVGESPREYDVIEPSGRVVGRVVLPAGGRVAGFGQGVVYVAMKDADDLVTIRRYPLPKPVAGQ